MVRRMSPQESKATTQTGVTLISFSVPPIANCAESGSAPPSWHRCARSRTYIPAGEMPYPVIHSFPSAA